MPCKCSSYFGQSLKFGDIDGDMIAFLTTFNATILILLSTDFECEDCYEGGLRQFA